MADNTITYTGSCECVGGVEETQRYHNSVMSLAKQQLIRQIASDFSNKLKLRNIDADASNIADVIKHLEEYVPNPHKNRKVYPADAKKQENACRVLAEILNKRLGRDVIDPHDKPEALCEKVFETLHAIFGSMTAELSAVRKDAERLLHNVNTLSQVLDAQYNRLARVLAAAEVASPGLKALREDYKTVKTELDRQVGMLNHMLDASLKPGTKSLDHLVKDMKKYKGLIKAIKSGPGGQEFGAKLSYIMAGMTTTAATAKIVDDALKEVGLTYAQYATLKDFKKLREELDDRTIKALGKDEKALKKYEKAKQHLFTFHYMHDQIVKELKKGGKEKKGGIKLDKRVKERQQLKNDLLRSFNNSLADHFQRVLRGVKSVSSGLASGKVKPDEKLNDFAKALDLLPDLNNSYIYYALSGYEQNAKAMQTRENFLSSIDHVIERLDVLIKDKDHGKFDAFKQIKIDFESMKRLIVAYSDKFEKGFGELKLGSDEGVPVPPSITTVAIDMTRIKNTILYYTQVAKVRESLLLANREGKAANEKYDELLGDAIASSLDAVREEHKKWAEQFDDPKNPLSSLFEGKDDCKASLKDFQGKLFKTKSDMYKTAEAVDLYLKSFTNAITANPDDVKDVLAMLNNIEIISRWHNNLSGDMLCNVFDSFPSAYDDGVAKFSKLPSGGQANEQYYDRVARMCFGVGGAVASDPIGTSANGLPGNPYLGLPVFTQDANGKKNFSDIDKYLEKALSVTMLKNIIAIFVNVADKFKGEKLSDKSVLSPIQISKNLYAYLKYSSITTGVDRFNMTRDVEMNGFGAVKNLAPNRAYADANNTFVSNNAANNFIRIGVHGNDTFSGYKRQLLNNLQAKSDELSSLYGSINSTHRAVVAGLAVGGVLLEATLAPGGAFANNFNDLFPKAVKLVKDYGVMISNLSLFVKKSISLTAELKDLLKDNKSSKVAKVVAKVLADLNLSSKIDNLKAKIPVDYALVGGNDVLSQGRAIYPEIVKMNAILAAANEYDTAWKQYVRIVMHNDDADLDQAAQPNRKSAMIDIIGSRSEFEKNGILSAAIQADATSQGAAADEKVLDDLLWREVGYVGMRGVGKFRHHTSNETFSPFKDPFVETDKLFTMTIKAIVAKILTAIGTFNIFNKPFNKEGMGFDSGIRLTLGGAEAPKILDDALELYIRLPLLAEFYRTIFQSEAGEQQSIGLIPEFENVFSGIIRLVFIDCPTGAYSDSDLKVLIEECNKIHIHYKGKSVTDIVNAFIEEVNARYGIVEAKDREAYAKFLERKWDDERADVKDTLPQDYELAGMDEDDIRQGLAPSRRYETGSRDGTINFKSHKHELKLDYYGALVRKLRTKIEALFSKCSKTQSISDLQDSFTFVHRIRSFREELKHSAGDKEKYSVVKRAVVGTSSTDLPALENAYVIIHELVATPLNALLALKNMVEAFKNNIDELDNVVKRADDLCAKIRAVPRVAIAAADFAGIDAKFSQNGLDFVNDVINVNASYGGMITTKATTSYADFIAYLNAAHASDDERDFKCDLATRFLFNQDTMLRQLIENLFMFAYDNDLIETRIEGAHDERMCSVRLNATFNVSALRDFVSKTLENTKNIVNKLRLIVPKATLDMFEALTANAKTASIYDLEKDFVYRLLNGQNSPADKLDNLGLKINNVLRALSKSYKGDLRQVDLTGAAPTFAGVGDFKYQPTNYARAGYAGAQKEAALNEFTREMYKLVLWDSSVGAAIGVASPSVAIAARVNTRTIRDILFDPVPAAAGGNNEPINRSISLVAPTFYDVNTGLRNDRNNSIVVMFNRLVAAYLNVIWLADSPRVYSTTISHFANESFSNAVRGNERLVIPAGADGYNKIDYNGVLLEELAEMFKILYTQTLKNKPETRYYLENDLNEIPAFMRDRYRASFPVMRKLFLTLIKRCEFLKHFVNTLNVAQMSSMGNLVIDASVAPNGDFDANLRYMRAQFNKYLDQVMVGSRGLIRCMDDTLAELGDKPQYLELYKGFNAEYKSLYGHESFTPVSSMQFYNNIAPIPAGDAITDDNYKLLASGAMYKKLNYGMRLLINGEKLTDSNASHIKHIIERFNVSVDSKHRVESVFSEIDNLSCGVKFEFDILNVKKLFETVSNYNNFARSDTSVTRTGSNFLTLAQATDLYAGIDPKQRILQLKNNADVTAVVQLTESSDTKLMRGLIIAQVSDKECAAAAPRDCLMVYNLIDMNVMPINLNALAREVPLINLHNYSYTFDKLICDLLDGSGDILTNGQIDPAKTSNFTNAAKSLMCVMMKDPYIDLPEDVYAIQWPRILRGELGIEGLGVPRYLYDEIFGKCLFGPTFGDQEAGPDASAADNRARRVNRAQAPAAAPAVNLANYKDNGFNEWVNGLQHNLVRREPDLKATDIGEKFYMLPYIGKMRFDTVLVRNLVWITNIQRLLRLKLRRDLTWYDSKVVSSHAVTASSITEQFGNDLASDNVDNYTY